VRYSTAVSKNPWRSNGQASVESGEARADDDAKQGFVCPRPGASTHIRPYEAASVVLANIPVRLRLQKQPLIPQLGTMQPPLWAKCRINEVSTSVRECLVSANRLCRRSPSSRHKLYKFMLISALDDHHLQHLKPVFESAIHSQFTSSFWAGPFQHCT
jgi:hypothetical protein